MTEQPQEAGTQEQAEQGMAQAWMDDQLNRILSSLVDKLNVYDLKLLCYALNIDVRDIS